MDLGTGVFLSGFFLGFVWLYVVTKDRWNWSKVIKRTMVVAVSIAAIGGGGLYLYHLYSNRLKAPLAMKGVNLGESLSELEFRFGKIELESTHAIRALTAALAQSGGSNSPDYQRIQSTIESYKADDAKVASGKATEQIYLIDGNRVSIVDGKVSYVSHECDTASSDYESVNGVQCGATSARIREVYGDELRIMCTKTEFEGDVPRRAYDSIRYGVRYSLAKDSVYRILIATPSGLDLHVGTSWHNCP